ncbi:MAG: hypothetical protein P4L53_10125 [Candidatus Obscuribacterales bacterium]|nr:hypothetical protein [Candidatus Obscuribacterales bacterium]
MLFSSKSRPVPLVTPRKKNKRVLLAITARYVGACPCGALIDVGNTIHYDTINHKAYCFNCGRIRANLRESALSHNERLEESRMAFECQPLIEDYRRLKLSDSALETHTRTQLKGILNIFQMSYATNPEVRSIVTAFINCKDSVTALSQGQMVHDFIAIAAKYKGVCVHCLQPIEAGRLCLYERSSKRLHCLLCDC